jgi:hypothetical protein
MNCIRIWFICSDTRVSNWTVWDFILVNVWLQDFQSKMRVQKLDYSWLSSLRTDRAFLPLHIRQMHHCDVTFVHERTWNAQTFYHSREIDEIAALFMKVSKNTEKMNATLLAHEQTIFYQTCNPICSWAASLPDRCNLICSWAASYQPDATQIVHEQLLYQTDATLICSWAASLPDKCNTDLFMSSLFTRQMQHSFVHEQQTRGCTNVNDCNFLIFTIYVVSCDPQRRMKELIYMVIKWVEITYLNIGYPLTIANEKKSCLPRVRSPL